MIFSREKTASFFLFLHNVADHFARNYPCGVMCSGILSVLLPQFLIPYSAVKIFLPVLFLLLAGALFGLRKTVFLFGIPALLAWGSFLFTVEQNRKDPVLLFAQNREQVGLHAVLRADDPALCGKDPVLLPNPKMIRCTLLRGAYAVSGRMKEMDGPVMLRLPKEYKNILSYGDILLVSGQLEKPGKALFPDTFDYRNYLAARGIHYILRADTVEYSGREEDFMSRLLDLRSRLCAKVLSRMPEENRAVTAALLFGCAQGVGKSTKQDLIRTGTIHILTVSGLHIGMFASLAAILCMLLPFRTRCFAIPFLTLLYACSTGLRMPAERALLMLGSYCFARGMLLNTNAVNSIFFAFFLLITCSPLQLGDPGMHYSFITTLVLLLAAEGISEWNRLLFEKYRWIPADAIPERFAGLLRFAGRVMQAVFGCIAAWGASFVLTLFYQGIATPSSAMVNFLFIPIVWCCFPVFFAGASVGLFLPGIDSCCAWCLNFLTDLLLFISGEAAGHTDIILPRPGVFLILFFLLLAGGILIFRANRKVVISCAAAGILAGFLYLSGFFMPGPEIAVIEGGGKTRPCIIASFPEEQFSMISDASSFDVVMGGASHLKNRGHRSLSCLAATGTHLQDLSGMKYVFHTIPVQELLLPERPRNTKSMEELRKTAGSFHTLCSVPGKEKTNFLAIVSDGSSTEYRIHCFRHRVKIKITPDRIEIRSDGRLLKDLSRRNSMEERITYLSLTR